MTELEINPTVDWIRAAHDYGELTAEQFDKKYPNWHSDPLFLNALDNELERQKKTNEVLLTPEDLGMLAKLVIDWAEKYAKFVNAANSEKASNSQYHIAGQEHKDARDKLFEFATLKLKAKT